MRLRTASLDDIPAIQAIVKEAWPVAYAGIISAEQINYMLSAMYDDASLTRQMTEEGCEFILACDGDQVVGFASYSEVGERRFKLHKLYLFSHCTGLGIGKVLLEESCGRAKASGGESMELQVNKKNSAKDFYLGNQFVIDRDLILDIGNGFVMDDFVMKRTL